MSIVKFWKALDIAGQILCVWLPLRAEDMNAPGDDVFYMYFILGGWQVVSFMAHKATKEKGNEARKLYGLLLLLIVVAGMVSAVLVAPTGALMLVLYAMTMMFIGPAMAVFYFVICVVEFISLLFSKREKTTDYETSDSE